MPAVFVVSLTENWDGLSQWRGYCEPGDGYAVGFRTESLRQLVVEAGWELARCDYGRSTEGQIQTHLFDLYNEYGQGRRQSSDSPSERAVEFLAEQLLPLAPVMKHAAFSDENEWRLISPPLDVFQVRFSSSAPKEAVSSREVYSQAPSGLSEGALR